MGSVCSSPGDLEEAGETSGWAEEGEASGPALRTGAGRMEADAALPRPCPRAEGCRQEPWQLGCL